MTSIAPIIAALRGRGWPYQSVDYVATRRDVRGRENESMSWARPIRCVAIVVVLGGCGSSSRDEEDAGDEATSSVPAPTTASTSTATTEPEPTTIASTTTEATTTEPEQTATTEPAGIARDTQLAVLGCSDELVSASTEFILGSGDGSTPSCEEAQNLLRLDGTDEAVEISEKIYECTRQLGQIMLRTIDGEFSTEAQAEEYFDCATAVGDLAVAG